jgi:fimbrial chaperone protein
MRKPFMRPIAAILSGSILLLAHSAASAASLQVSPVSLEMTAPAAAATLTLNNPGEAPLKAQIRVMRWSLVNGEEHLEPATDVVASPPMATLQPKSNYTVRVVRLTKQPAVTEESYRLLVDEIPDRASLAPATVTMAFRYSIPVFFYPQTAIQPALTWSVERREGKVFVSATNTGTRHVRISDLQISDAKRTKSATFKGLAGYVLARSSKSWVAPGDLQKVAGSGPLLVTAQGDTGPINANALPAAPR